MKIGSTTINSCKIGSTQVNEVRIGSILVWSYSSFDPDAQLFITNAAITDTTQQNAVNNLVVALKGYGIWSKMKALYPFVGGTSSQHKYNLRNPLDTDAAFRLTFFGGVTHSSNGITGNGTNGYADTFLNDQTILDINNKHISMYQRNILTSPSGSSMGTGNSNRFYLNFSGSNYSTLGMAQSPFTIVTPQNGMFTMSKIISNEFKYYQNSLASVTKTGTNTPQNLKHFILACNTIGNPFDYSLANLSFASIGDGLTDTEASNMYTAVQAFQVSLSRNV